MIVTTAMNGPENSTELLQRALYKEFLLEPGLYLEAGLEDLPRRLASHLSCGEQEAIPLLLSSANLEPLSIDDLKFMLSIRDMNFSRTAAAVAMDLVAPAVTYDRCIRIALCYAVLGRYGHVFSALRAAAAKDDKYARHHHVYGLVLALQGNAERANWELGFALAHEPFEECKARIRQVQGLV